MNPDSVAVSCQPVGGPSKCVRLRGIDHVELYTGNPAQAAHFYRTTLGLHPIAYAGTETGVDDRCSYVVSDGETRLVLTGPTIPDTPIATYLNRHGDGVCDIAFLVDDVESAFETALARGASPVLEPRVRHAGERMLKRASIRAFGDVVHSFIERKAPEWFLPDFSAIQPADTPATCVRGLDHIAVVVQRGTLDALVSFYQSVFGFRQSHEEHVLTGSTGMRSKVVEQADGGPAAIKLPLVEPVPGSGGRRSHVEEYLSSNGGPGVQHLACLCDDIIGTIMTLKNRGVSFLATPATYYDVLPARVGDGVGDIDVLRDLHVLVDNDADGHIFQIFTKPVQARPTFFWEIIQRKGGRGFGSGNIKALFEAAERERQMHHAS